MLYIFTIKIILYQFHTSNRPDARRRRRRDVPDSENTKDGTASGKNNNGGNFTIVSLLPASNTTQPPVTNVSEPIPDVIYQNRVNVTDPDDDASIELTNLDHFAEYRIELYACNSRGCGKKSVVFGRTVPKRK